jgi:hypothetical protein
MNFPPPPLAEAQQKQTMKTQIICPNKNDPAWIRLVAEIGEARSFIAFFRNGNLIPDVLMARQLLNIKPKTGRKPAPRAESVEIRTPALQFRRVDAHTIKGGQIATPRGGKPHSNPRRQPPARQVFKVSAESST